MAGVYSARLIGVTRIVTPGVQQLLATVPAGETWVIKRYQCCQGGTTSRIVFGMDVTFGVKRVWDVNCVAGVGIDNETRLVLVAGDKLYALAATAGAVIDVTCSGYRLPG